MESGYVRLGFIGLLKRGFENLYKKMFSGGLVSLVYKNNNLWCCRSN